MQRVFESCPFRATMSFVVGGALGAFLGLFSSSIAPHQVSKVELLNVPMLCNPILLKFLALKSGAPSTMVVIFKFHAKLGSLKLW